MAGHSPSGLFITYPVREVGVEESRVIASIGSEAIMHRDEAHDAAHDVSELLFNRRVLAYRINWARPTATGKFPKDGRGERGGGSKTYEREEKEAIVPSESANQLDANEDAREKNQRVEDEEEAGGSNHTLLIGTHGDGVLVVEAGGLSATKSDAFDKFFLRRWNAGIKKQKGEKRDDGGFKVGCKWKEKKGSWVGGGRWEEGGKASWVLKRERK